MPTLSKSPGKADAARPKKPSDPAAPADPMKVAADPSLSDHDKLNTLSALEQDARQLAIAASEGMSGGEETNLREVLQAKRALEPPSVESAFAAVAAELEQQLGQTMRTSAHAVISQAIDAIAAARRVIAERANAPLPPPGVPVAGSAGELQEELEKEKLDPGG